MSFLPAPDGDAPAVVPARAPHVLFEAFQPAFEDHCEPLIVSVAHALLTHARTSRWPIGHVLRRPLPRRGAGPICEEAWRPLPGFEPAWDEMSFTTVGDSPFSSRLLEERFVAFLPHRVLFMTLASRESCSSTLEYARQRRIPFQHVRNSSDLATVGIHSHLKQVGDGARDSHRRERVSGPPT